MEEKTVDYFEVINDLRMELANNKFDENTINNKIDSLQKEVKALNFTVTESLRMCQIAFLQCKEGILACKKSLDLCKDGYDNCRDAFEDIEIPTQDVSGFALAV